MRISLRLPESILIVVPARRAQKSDLTRLGSPQTFVAVIALAFRYLHQTYRDHSESDDAPSS